MQQELLSPGYSAGAFQVDPYRLVRLLQAAEVEPKLMIDALAYYPADAVAAAAGLLHDAPPRMAIQNLGDALREILEKRSVSS